MGPLLSGVGLRQHAVSFVGLPELRWASASEREAAEAVVPVECLQIQPSVEQ